MKKTAIIIEEIIEKILEELTEKILPTLKSINLKKYQFLKIPTSRKLIHIKYTYN